MIWYDERLAILSKETLRPPNCFVNLKVDGAKVIQMFNRDSVTLLGTINMEFWQGMVNMDPESMKKYGQFMGGFEDFEQWKERKEWALIWMGNMKKRCLRMECTEMVFEEDYVDGDYADEWYDDAHQDL